MYTAVEGRTLLKQILHNDVLSKDKINLAVMKLPLALGTDKHLQLQKRRVVALAPQVAFAAPNLLAVLQLETTRVGLVAAKSILSLQNGLSFSSAPAKEMLWLRRPVCI